MKASQKIAQQANELFNVQLPKAVKRQQNRIIKFLNKGNGIPKILAKEKWRDSCS